MNRADPGSGIELRLGSSLPVSWLQDRAPLAVLLLPEPPHRRLPPDYFLFCELLLQRPLHPGQLALSNLLTREETAYMQAMAQHHFDRIMGVLKALPRPMLLVFRNINTVRSINVALGAPADRYFLMAKR